MIYMIHLVIMQILQILSPTTYGFELAGFTTTAGMF
jgi:hypothetical protein